MSFASWGETASSTKQPHDSNTHNLCISISLCHSRSHRVLCALLYPHLLRWWWVSSSRLLRLLLWITRCIISTNVLNMHRSAAGKLSLRAAQASRSFSTSSGSQRLARSQQNALVAGRNPLAVMARSSLQCRGYAMAAEESNKGVVC